MLEPCCLCGASHFSQFVIEALTQDPLFPIQAPLSLLQDLGPSLSLREMV